MKANKLSWKAENIIYKVLADVITTYEKDGEKSKKIMIEKGKELIDYLNQELYGKK